MEVNKLTVVCTSGRSASCMSRQDLYGVSCCTSVLPVFFFLLLLMPVYLVYLRSREYELATLTRSQFIQNGTVENPFQVDESHVIR